MRALRRSITQLKSSGNLTIDPTSGIARRSKILSTSKGVVAKDVLIGNDFRAEVDFEVGEGSLISSGVSFVGKDHDLNSTESVSRSPRLKPGKIVLVGDNLVGYGSIVIAPCRMGKGVVVGAGSVVTKDLPVEDGIYAGVPCKLIGTRERR